MVMKLQKIKTPMKNLKLYLESLFDDEDDLATNDIPIIESFLKNNYTISGDVNIREENGIYIVDVDGDVDIKNYNLKKFCHRDKNHLLSNL